jgi:hypothetical protein
MMQSQNRMKKLGIFVSISLALLLLTSGLSLAAATPQQTIELRRAVGASGFTSVTESGVTLRATLGQPFVGISSINNVSLSQGFWHGIPIILFTIYLPMVVRDY